MTIVKYTLARLALIAVFVGVFYLLGMRSYLLAAASILCGAMVSFLVLPKIGDAAARDVEEMMHRDKPRPGAHAEDAELDGEID